MKFFFSNLYQIVDHIYIPTNCDIIAEVYTSVYYIIFFQNYLSLRGILYYPLLYII